MSKQGPAIPRELAQEIARQAESRLQSTKDIAGITVARATTLCGIFGAAAIALAAAVLAYLGVNDHETRLVAAGALTAVILLLAAGLAALAGASRKFRVAGCDPIELRKWCWDAQSATWRSEEELLTPSARSSLLQLRRTEIYSPARDGSSISRLASPWRPWCLDYLRISSGAAPLALVTSTV